MYMQAGVRLNSHHVPNNKSGCTVSYITLNEHLFGKQAHENEKFKLNIVTCNDFHDEMGGARGRTLRGIPPHNAHVSTSSWLSDMG